MIKDSELGKMLNLLRLSPKFIYKEAGDRGECKVVSPSSIPKSAGIYWVSGNTKIEDGRNIDSVFIIDTDSGGTLLEIYWWLDNQWHKHQDESALESLDLQKRPKFDWSYNVKLEEDIYHD
jgi:hypothetical protein